MTPPPLDDTRSAAAEQRHLPHWVPRAVAVFFLGLGLFLVTGWILLQLQSLLIILLVSLVLSFALEPPVNRLERVGIRRGLATLLVLLGSLVVTGLFAWVIGRLVATQVADLIERGPTYIERAQDWLNRSFDAEFDADTLIKEFQEGGRLADVASVVAPNIVAIGARVLGLLFEALTVGLFTFYLVADGPRLRRAVCSVFPPERQRELLRVWDVATEKTGGYILSRALLAAASLAVHWIAFSVIGIPSPAALALWVAVISQFVPVVGTYLAGLLPILLALLDRPISALWVLVVIVVYQQVENYLLAPRVTAQTMEIHAAVAFGAVLAGTALLGPIGAILALPLAATATAVASTYVQRHEVVNSRLTNPRWRRGTAAARPDPRLGAGLEAGLDDESDKIDKGRADASSDRGAGTGTAARSDDRPPEGRR